MNINLPTNPQSHHRPPLSRGELLAAVKGIASEAGHLVMAVYAQDFTVRGKADQSPVTEADECAERLIVRALEQLTPEIPVVAEERVAAGTTPTLGQRFWLVDPLDGTKEFIQRNGQFTVNIALIEDGVPTLGVVLAPALGSGGQLYSGDETLGAWLDDAEGSRRIQCRPAPAQGLTVVASRSHGDAAALDAYLKDLPVAERISAGSSLKLCLVASGQADLYPRLGTTMEWDIAAGHAILRAAGGWLGQAYDHAALAYGKPDLKNPHFLAAAQRPA